MIVLTCNIVSPLRIVPPLTESNTQSPCRRGINPFEIKEFKLSQGCKVTFLLSVISQLPHG